MKSWVIYKHTCLVNGKSYIGQTNRRANLRWQSGKGYRSQSAFGLAIAKYGWDSFTHEILEKDIATQELANEREIYWISYYHTFVGDPECNGYNMTTGGSDPKIHLAKYSEDAKAKMAHNKGCKFSDSHRAKISESLKGHTVSDETRAKLSEACVGRESAFKGHHFSEESKKLLSESRSKKVYCIENGIVYSSLTIAGAELHVSTKRLKRCCETNEELNGLHYKF